MWPWATSFTEGLDDERPDGTYRGWADRFAQRAGAAAPELRYANLAVRGKKIDQVIDEQVPAAVALQPDLVSLAAGINDAAPQRDVDRVGQRLAEGVEALRESGAQVLLTCVGDPARRSVALRTLAKRINAYDDHVRRIADTYGCYLMDFWGSRSSMTPVLVGGPPALVADRPRAGFPCGLGGGGRRGRRLARPAPPAADDSWLAARTSDAKGCGATWVRGSGGGCAE